MHFQVKILFPVAHLKNKKSSFALILVEYKSGVNGLQNDYNLKYLKRFCIHISDNEFKLQQTAQCLDLEVHERLEILQDFNGIALPN